MAERLQNDASLSSAQVRDFFQRNLAELDTNHNGRVSGKELDLFEPTTDLDKQALAILKHDREEISRLSKDAWFSECGISENDIEQNEIKGASDYKESVKKIEGIAESF